MNPKHSPKCNIWPALLRLIGAAVLVLAVAGLLPAAQPAKAQPAAQAKSSITMQATAAYKGYFKYGEWLPIWVELQNQGGDLDGEIRVEVSGSTGTMVFAAPVSLPAGARKLLPVYVLPNAFSRELTVQLVSQGKSVQSVPVAVRPQTNITYVVGLLAPQRGALGLLNGLTFPRQDRAKVLVDLQLSDLPERAEGLGSFDLLVLNDLDTTKLTPDQASALTGWVQKGGRLVVGGGPGVQHTLAGLPEGLLPAKVEGTGETGADSAKALADYAAKEPIAITQPVVMARAAPLDNSRMLVSSGATPLVLEHTYGAGTVDFVAFDLAGLPFNGWPGTQAFWETLLGQSLAYPENMPFDLSARQFRANQLQYPLQNIPSLDLPSIQGISILLGIYILFVGPINYFILRWRKRLHWAWVTIPVITLMFAGLSFAIGYSLRGNDLILNKIALVDLKPDGTAAVSSYMGLFSPRMQSYEITVQGESLVSPMMGFDPGPWAASGQPGGGNQMTFIQGEPSRIQGLTVNQWAMQSFMAEDTWPDFGRITGDLRIENEVLLGKIKNESRYTIKDVVVTIQSRFTRLGDMAPGEEKVVNFGLSSLQSDRFGPPLSYRLFQENITNGPLPRAQEQKSAIISTLFEQGPMSKFGAVAPMGGESNSTSQSVRVFGWLDQAPPTVSVGDNRLTQKTTALVITTLDYGLPTNGVLSLPAGMVPGSLVKVTPDGGICGTQTSLHLVNGQAEFEYQLPASLKDFQINALKLGLYRDSGGAGMWPTFALYNWKDQAWTNLQDPIQGTNLIQKAGPYVNESGAVRVQVNAKSDTMGCIYIDLGVEAERTGQGG